MRGGFLLLVLLGSIPSIAQVTISDFIRSGVDAPQVKSIEDQVSYLKTKPYQLSPLQKLEFRTQNRELLSYQQEYALRFNPANPWEVRNNNQYFQDFQTSLSLEQGLVLKEVLQERYRLLIDYLYFLELKTITEHSAKLISDQLAVLERQAGSTVFDADDFVSLKVELVDKSVDIEEIEFEIGNQRMALNKLYPSAYQKEFRLDEENIITVDVIEVFVDSLQRRETSAQVAFQRQMTNLAQSEYRLEKSNVNLGFLQTEYDRRRVTQDRTPFNISLGITIPITNPNKGDMTKRKLDVIEAEYDLKKAENQNLTSKDMAREQLKLLITNYRALENKILELQSTDLPSQLSAMKGSNPAASIKHYESISKLKSLKAKLSRVTRSTFIDYLAATDQLQQRPLLNFLLGNLESTER
jgi:hypothetical protein